MKKGLLILIGVLMLTSLVACGSPDTTKEESNSSDGKSESVINIATVNNPDMARMEELSSKFTEETGIEVKFTVLPENELRQKVTQDITLGTEVYDIVTASNFNIPTWAEMGSIEALDPYFDKMSDDEKANYDKEDLISPVLDSVSYNDELYGMPFYSESMVLFYRKDLFEKAGIEMPEEPTWEEIYSFAQKLHDPSKDISGIVLRGMPAWGQNMVIVNPIMNAFGARWYDENWNPQFDSKEMKEALEFYKNILQEYGQKEPVTTGYTEALALMTGGNAAMWMDASVSGSALEADDSSVKGKIGYVKAPSAKRGNTGGIGGWSLAITSTSEHKDEAFKFLTWVSSKEYIDLIAEEYGWSQVLSGTRESTYKNQEYLDVAPFAQVTIDSLKNATYNEPTVDPVPYRGNLYLQIPEYEDLGTRISQEVAAYLSDQQSIDETIASCQQIAEEVAKEAGYLK